MSDQFFARILVGYDDSPSAESALAAGLTLARQYGGTVIVVNVADIAAAAVVPIHSGDRSTPRFDPEPVLTSLDPYRRDLYRDVSAAAAAFDVPVGMEFAMNVPATGILDAAERWNATSIAIGTHARRGLAHALIGSVAEEVVRSALVPVIVARAGCVRPALRRIVVGVDAVEPSASAQRLALALGEAGDVELVYCSVADTASIMAPEADLAFDPAAIIADVRTLARGALDRAARAAADAGIRATTDVTDATTAGIGLCATAAARDADAIVVGTHRRSAVERFFVGSTAEAVMRGAGRTVIVVPDPDPSDTSLDVAGVGDGHARG